MKEEPKATHVFEVSWEVCNKVGGIYSVLSSKSSYMQDLYESYYAIGPYIEAKAEEDFEETKPPDEFKDITEALAHRGITLHFGKWLVKEQPNTILIEYDGLWEHLNDYKTKIWETHGVDTLNSGGDVHDPLLLSVATAEFLKMAHAKNAVPDTTVLHAHEWLTGFTVLHLDTAETPISTVFTTHATILGRTISTHTRRLYEDLGSFNPEEKAKEYNIADKHTAEKAAANTADVFTTVSKITARECTYIHGREPDVLVLNGLDINHFPSLEEASVQHRENRETIREFLRYTFYPYYTFNTEQNLTYLFAGRYEYENKGLDVYLEALGKLNETLRNTDTKRTVSAFLCIAMPNNGPKYDILKSKNYYRHVKHQLQRQSDELIDGLLYDLLSGANRPERELIEKESFDDIRRSIHRFQSEHEHPPLCSHNIHGGEENTKIIQAMRRLGLHNREEDPVKVILYPAYLDGNDNLLNLKYFDMISGSHLGIFPSYYEPWGYTPLETAAMGVPSVTTDLAGYGRYMVDEVKDLADEGGVYVVERDGKTYTEVVNQLHEVLLSYAEQNHAERVKDKIKAKMLSEVADWENFIKFYVEAHNAALNR